MWSGSNEGQSVLCSCLPAECGQDSPSVCPGRGGVGGRVQGQKERREEGRTGRVRSEVATDRFGSLKSLQFSWKAAARGRRRMWRGEGFQIQSAHQPSKSGRERTGSQSREAERARNHNTENLDISHRSLSPFESLTHQIDFEPVCLNTRTLLPAHLLLVLQGGGSAVSLFGVLFYFGEEKKFFGVLMVSGAAEVLIFFYPSFSDVMSRLSRTMESGPEPGRHWRRSLSPGRVLPPLSRGDADLLPPSHRLSVCLGPPPRTCLGGLRAGEGVRQEAAPEEAHAARLQALQPQRRREDPGSQRATRGQKLRATRSALKSWRRITTQTLSSRMRRTRALTGSWHRWGGEMSG